MILIIDGNGIAGNLNTQRQAHQQRTITPNTRTMAYKPDKYHQTDPPCELKSAVMGRQNSRKKNEAKEETKPENGSLSGAATCSADFLSKKEVYASFENEERNILIKHHREKRDAYTDLAELIKERTNNSKQIARFRTLSSRHNRRAVSLQNVKLNRREANTK